MAEERDSITYDEIVNQNLKNMGMGILEEQPSKIREYLLRIECIIQQHKVKKEELLKQYKECKISLVGISRSTKIARQTLYNNKILEQYIGSRINEENDKEFINERIQLRQKIQFLEEEIYKMQKRDLEIEIQAYKIKELKNDIKTNHKTIENLEIRNRQLIEQINKLEYELRSNKNKVIDFEKNRK